MAAGDETAYRLFYDAYFDRLWRYLIVVTSGNEDAAREALQATLTRVVRHIRVFSSEPVFWSWLTVLARSALTDQTRKHRRYLVFLDRFSQHAAVENAPADKDTDERLRQLLDRHIATLSDEERHLVEAKYFAHRSVRDLAAELQTTEKTIESRLARIRQKLKNTVLAELKNESSD
jgi:RNA polymerase sigma-70 factor, ECF subfamily